MGPIDRSEPRPNEPRPGAGRSFPTESHGDAMASGSELAAGTDIRRAVGSRYGKWFVNVCHSTVEYLLAFLNIFERIIQMEWYRSITQCLLSSLLTVFRAIIELLVIY